VAFAGKLEDMRPADILIFMADFEKTGKLKFTTGTQEGMIVFRGGKIIYAASSSVRETFGSIALALDIVNRKQLDKALLLQNKSREEKRLGEILVEIRAMNQSEVEKILIHQVSQVVREIFEWETGYFKFRNLDIEQFGDIEVDARDFVVESPLDTRSVALDAARMQDENSRNPGPAEEDSQEATEHTTLSQLMNDAAGPALTAEIIREIFEVADKTFARGVVFAVHDHSSRGLAQFGLVETIAPPSQRIHDLWMSMDDYSIITTVVRDREVFHRQPDFVRAKQKLVRALGGEWPPEAVAIPIMIGDRVGLVFYGDNQPSGASIRSTAALEATLQSVGSRLARAQQ
jgi:hypothetical protein